MKTTVPPHSPPIAASAFAAILTIAVAASPTTRVEACGGFFCQSVPINQAAEQIIFRQDGVDITAVVLIQYAGEAEDFSWVVPVPGIPELSTGSDVLFQSLELATRPQFNLTYEGDVCPEIGPFDMFGGGSPGQNTNDNEADDGVTVLERLAVGPFDVEVVNGSDPVVLAQWLEDNGYDLSERGSELIATYVEEECNFVALKLRQDQGVGDIRPLIMKYESDHPVIPIRLTAVAAQDDMGVLVWLLGGSRAVPLNYLHVHVNYTLVNWYAGSTNAYASYQNLVTTAMNEAGGQGFATDFAGRLPDLLDQLPSAESYEAESAVLAAAPSDRQFYDGLASGLVLPADQILEMLRRELPLPEGVDEFVYQSGSTLAAVFSDDQLAAARVSITRQIEEEIIAPLSDTLAVFEGDPYMTRFYTTLSPNEMTVDPEFSFNPDLGDQALARNAKLVLGCDVLRGTTWHLELGAGTDRDGEVVLRGEGDPPFFAAPAIDQPAVSKTEWLRERGQAESVQENHFDIADVVANQTGGLCGSGFGGCGAVPFSSLLLGLIGLRSLRRQNRNH